MAAVRKRSARARDGAPYHYSVNRSLPPPQNQRGICAAEAEGIAQGIIEAGLCRLAHELKLAERIRPAGRSRRRKPLRAQGHEANRGFARARRAKQMTDARLRRTDAQRRRPFSGPAIDGS